MKIVAEAQQAVYNDAAESEWLFHLPKVERPFVKYALSRAEYDQLARQRLGMGRRI